MSKTTREPVIYRTYKFHDYDPAMDTVVGLVEDAGVTQKKVSDDTNVSTSTLGNWKRRKTKRPQFATLNAVARSFGKEFRLMPIRRGN